MRPLASVVGVLLLIVALVVVVGVSRDARAVVTEVPVTTAYLKDDKSFAIEATTADDGLIHFKVTHHLTRPAYVVTRFTAQEEGALVTEKLIETSSASVVRETSVTHHVAVAPKLLPTAWLELAERDFVESSGDAVPLPGGTDYTIRLADFAPQETEPK